ncbi:MAG: hypothetical protein M9894_17805 [Planctomycetes bacterium]|nr:hypothetical protein [Planctomycetota bacterium]
MSSEEAPPVVRSPRPPRRLALAAALAVGLTPIAVARAAPQTDVVFHLRHAAAWRTGGDAHHEVTDVSPLRPYQVTYRAMGLALGAARGEVVLVGLGALSVLASALAAASLASAGAGVAARPALVALFGALAYTGVYYDGFLTFRLGQAAALALLARRLDRPGPRGPGLDVALLAAAYLLHPFALGLCILAVALVRTPDPGPWRRAPEAAALLLALATATAGGGAHGGAGWLLEDVRLGLTATAVEGKLAHLLTEPFARRSLVEGALGLGGLLLAATALAAPRRAEAPDDRGLRRVLAAVTALYLLLPYQLASIAAVNERFAPTVCVLALALLARRAAWPPSPARRGALGLAAGALLAAATLCHLRLEAHRAEFRPLLAHMAPGGRLHLVDLAGGPAPCLAARDYLLEGGGVLPNPHFINALLPARQRPMPAPRHPEDVEAHLHADYVALRLAPGRELPPTFAGLFREVARAGRWRLLQPAR